eukprot:4596566-Pleurochrysis_carterae.AAC.1
MVRLGESACRPTGGKDVPVGDSIICLGRGKASRCYRSQDQLLYNRTTQRRRSGCEGDGLVAKKMTQRLRSRWPSGCGEDRPAGSKQIVRPAQKKVRFGSRWYR